MKVFEVLREALDVKQLPDGEWAIIDTETGRPASPIRFQDPGAAEEARDAMRARTSPSTSRTPPSSSTTPSSPELTPGVRQGTPTTQSLTTGERRRLARTGSITRRGVTYTSAQIQAATDEFARLSNIRSPELRGDQREPAQPPASRSRNPEPPPGLIKKYTSRALKALRSIVSAKMVTVIEGAINLSALEDSLDAYLRAVRDAGNNITADAERQQFLNRIRSGNLPPQVQEAYYQCIQRVTELFIQIPITILTGGAAAVSIPALAAGAATIGIATGGWALLAAIVAGGILAFAGTEALYALTEKLGWNDAAERMIARWLTPPNLVEWAVSADDTQALIGGTLASAWAGTVGAVGLSGVGPIPTPQEVGDIVRDDINETSESNTGLEALKDMIRSDPKLMQAYKDGKEEAKQLMRSKAEVE